MDTGVAVDGACVGLAVGLGEAATDGEGVCTGGDVSPPPPHPAAARASTALAPIIHIHFPRATFDLPGGFPHKETVLPRFRRSTGLKADCALGRQARRVARNAEPVATMARTTVPRTR